MINSLSLKDILDENNIKYSTFVHPALYTVDDSKKMRGKIDGAHTKNLFLKNKKNEFFLFSCLESSRIELKLLKKNLNLGNISFAKEEYLNNLLGVKPGSVTPFGLLNDLEKKIKFFFDSKLEKYQSFNFHPLINTETINIKKNDFYNLFKIYNITINLINFETYGSDGIR
tara:strand:- start:265 stop:777 length:513 start_codon:yes stop_codon:yes gene_type:complete